MMGRELRRVALDFDWPLEKVWPGFVYDGLEEPPDDWEGSPPPDGAGYQVWETVSEGSPVSPVFKATDEVVGWIMGEGYSREVAEAFLESGYCASAMIYNGTFHTLYDGLLVDNILDLASSGE